jgi:hypothetical protein
MPRSKNVWQLVYLPSATLSSCCLEVAFPFTFLIIHWYFYQEEPYDKAASILFCPLISTPLIPVSILSPVSFYKKSSLLGVSILSSFSQWLFIPHLNVYVLKGTPFMYLYYCIINFIFFFTVFLHSSLA